jgi:hypothetical protein
MADMTEAQVKVLEKVISDEEFRASFLKNPDLAVARSGIEISDEEMARIKAIDTARIKGAIAEIDERISKTSVGNPIDVGTAIEEAFTRLFVVL